MCLAQHKNRQEARGPGARARSPLISNLCVMAGVGEGVFGTRQGVLVLHVRKK
jgi:hypothetical protein